MRVGVVGDFVAATEDLSDEVRIGLRAFANDEESCARVKTFQQIEHSVRVLGGGAVVDCDPYFRCGGWKGLNNWAPPLAARYQGRVEQ